MVVVQGCGCGGGGGGGVVVGGIFIFGVGTFDNDDDDDDDDADDDDDGNLQITHVCNTCRHTIFNAHVYVLKYAIVYAHVNCSNWIKVAHLSVSTGSNLTMTFGTHSCCRRP